MILSYKPLSSKEILEVLQSPIITNEGYVISYLYIMDTTIKSVIGMVSINVFNDDDGHKSLYIRDLVMLPEYQHKGYGSLIVSYIVKGAVGMYRIKLEADNDSKSFWLKQGFHLTGDISEGRPVMMLDLQLTKDNINY